MSRISIIKETAVVIDGDGEEVDLSDLPPGVHAVHFDEETGKGTIEYDATATRSVTVRDFELEEKEYREALKNNKDLTKLVPRFKSIQVPRGVEPLTSFAPFEKFVQRRKRPRPPKGPKG